MYFIQNTHPCAPNPISPMNTQTISFETRTLQKIFFKQAKLVSYWIIYDSALFCTYSVSHL